MRNGILWAALLFLSSASFVDAQSASALKGPVPTTASPSEPRFIEVDTAKPEKVAAPPDIVQPDAPPETAPAVLPPISKENVKKDADAPSGNLPVSPTPLLPISSSPTPAPRQRISVSVDYLLWWAKGGPLNTPLLTTGELPDVPPGALGQPSTQVLFGDHPMHYGALSGVRFGAAIDLGAGIALEGNYFTLQTGALHYFAGSDASGNPRIDRPFFNNQFGLPDTFGTSEPSALLGPFGGSTAIASHSQLQGWEINLSAGQPCPNGWRLVGLVGFRALRLDEDLSIRDNLTNLAPNVLTFLGAPVGVGDTVADFDYFHTSNRFYGGQIGGRWEWQNGRFDVAATAKIAFGVTQQIATIDGGSSWTSPAGTVTAPGGILAQPSNMGRYYHSTFSVVPEAGINFTWHVTPRLNATIGYTFLYWTHVARPGALIDSNINSSQVPTSQLFGTPGGSARPTFTFQNSDYWAQGLNFGLEFKF
jgi:hypothetical protein